MTITIVMRGGSVDVCHLSDMTLGFHFHMSNTYLDCSHPFLRLRYVLATFFIVLIPRQTPANLGIPMLYVVLKSRKWVLKSRKGLVLKSRSVANSNRTAPVFPSTRKESKSRISKTKGAHFYLLTVCDE